MPTSMAPRSRSGPGSWRGSADPSSRPVPTTRPPPLHGHPDARPRPRRRRQVGRLLGLAAQNGELVAQHDDLEILRSPRAHRQPSQRHEEPVQDANHEPSAWAITPGQHVRAHFGPPQASSSSPRVSQPPISRGERCAGGIPDQRQCGGSAPEAHAVAFCGVSVAGITDLVPPATVPDVMRRREDRRMTARTGNDLAHPDSPPLPSRRSSVSNRSAAGSRSRRAAGQSRQPVCRAGANATP